MNISRRSEEASRTSKPSFRFDSSRVKAEFMKPKPKGNPQKRPENPRSSQLRDSVGIIWGFPKVGVPFGVPFKGILFYLGCKRVTPILGNPRTEQKAVVGSLRVTLRVFFLTQLPS